MSTYFDKFGQRTRRPLKRRTPPADPNLDDDKTQLILEIAAEHPRFVPEEVHFVICRDHRRSDITKDMVRYVLNHRASS